MSNFNKDQGLLKLMREARGRLDSLREWFSTVCLEGTDCSCHKLVKGKDGLWKFHVGGELVPAMGIGKIYADLYGESSVHWAEGLQSISLLFPEGEEASSLEYADFQKAGEAKRALKAFVVAVDFYLRETLGAVRDLFNSKGLEAEGFDMQAVVEKIDKYFEERGGLA